MQWFRLQQVVINKINKIFNRNNKTLKNKLYNKSNYNNKL